MKKVLLILPLALMLAACQSSPMVLTNPVLQNRATFVPPEVPPARQTSVNWIVLTKDNAAQKIAELERTQGVVAVFALTPQGYQNLSLNVSELRRYIQQQNATIAAIRQYYETPVGENNANQSR